MTDTRTDPPAVTVEHWSARRVTAGDTIERWSIDYEGRTLLTFESEIAARGACRKHGWIVTNTVELGWIN